MPRKISADLPEGTAVIAAIQKPAVREFDLFFEISFF